MTQVDVARKVYFHGDEYIEVDVQIDDDGTADIRIELAAEVKELIARQLAAQEVSDDPKYLAR